MGEHYYTKQPTCREEIEEIKVNIFGNEITLKTGSGVFSIGRLDKGTQVLLNLCQINKNDRVLDLGAGYGIVGIAIAKAFPKSCVVLTDVNQRAIKLARQNIKLNKLDNVSAVSGDCFEKVKGSFDTILLNPPQVAGKKICEKMIEESRQYLNPGGTLQIVARKNKGGETLAKKISEVFGKFEVLGKKGGFWVYCGKKTNSRGE